MGKFWEWNKRLLKNDTPIFGFHYEDDGDGNKGFDMFMGKSRFQYKKEIQDEETEDVELLEHKKRKVLR